MKNKQHTTVDGVRVYTPEGRLWNNMINRCRANTSTNPRMQYYVGCTNMFADFDAFVEWCRFQTGFNQKDEGGKVFHLDKDICGDGYSYSPDNCVFVPQQINTFGLVRKSHRGDLPIGVTLDKGRFKAALGIGGGTFKYVGTFDTPDQAFAAYKSAKEDHAKFLATKWESLVDKRVYNYLLNYEVDIHD